jgi:hypothetical protein
MTCGREVEVESKWREEMKLRNKERESRSGGSDKQHSSSETDEQQEQCGEEDNREVRRINRSRWRRKRNQRPGGEKHPSPHDISQAHQPARRRRESKGSVQGTLTSSERRGDNRVKG